MALEVTGSIPVARPKFFKRLSEKFFALVAQEFVSGQHWGNSEARMTGQRGGRLDDSLGQTRCSKCGRNDGGQCCQWHAAVFLDRWIRVICGHITRTWAPDCVRYHMQQRLPSLLNWGGGRPTNGMEPGCLRPNGRSQDMVVVEFGKGQSVDEAAIVGNQCFRKSLSIIAR